MMLADPVTAQIIKTLNPDFQPPQRPFMRMDYRDAIKYLNEHDILNEDGKPHVDGDDIAEAAERKMTDDINRPIMLIHFPKHLKSFYMSGLPNDPNYTESVDVLVPGVGEVVGGSMRINDLQELIEGYKRSGIPMEPYYWFTDQRKYGTTEHGGYGLGVEVSFEKLEWTRVNADEISDSSRGCSDVTLSESAACTLDTWAEPPHRLGFAQMFRRLPHPLRIIACIYTVVIHPPVPLEAITASRVRQM
jgi:hypothetical protein